MKEKIEELIKKYQKELDEIVILDDFEYGRFSTLEDVISDLQNLLKQQQ